MLRISYWAYNNRGTARLLMVGLYVLLNVCGAFIGSFLFEIGYLLPYFLIHSLLFVGFILICLYPGQNNKRTFFKSSYSHRKAFDLLLSTTTFLLVVSTSNNNSFGTYPTLNALYPSEKNSSTTVPLHKEKLKEWRNLKKLLSKSVHLKGAKKVNVKKVLLVLLALVVAIVALYGIAALSCSLACSGAETFAWIVAIIGTAAVIFLLVKIIRKIVKAEPVPKKYEG